MADPKRRKYMRKTFGKVVHGHYPIPPGFELFKQAIAVMAKPDTWAVMAIMGNRGYCTKKQIMDKLAADADTVNHWLGRMRKCGLIVRVDARGGKYGRTKVVRYYQTETFSDVSRFIFQIQTKLLWAEPTTKPVDILKATKEGAFLKRMKENPFEEE